MTKLHTCQDLADRYGVELFTIWQWIRNKKLPAIKIGKEYRISEDDLNEFEESRRTVKKEDKSSVSVATQIETAEKAPTLEGRVSEICIPSRAIHRNIRSTRQKQKHNPVIFDRPAQF